MAPSTKKLPLSSDIFSDTSITPEEKDRLLPDDFEKGIRFFGNGNLIRVANRFDLRQNAYRYLHNIYLNEGYAENDDSKMQLSIYNALPYTTTLFAEDRDGNFNGTITIAFDSEIGLPSDAQYKEEIDQLRRDQRRICEIMSFGVDKAQRGSVWTLSGLFYCAFLLAKYVRTSTDFIINVVPGQTDFYCKNIYFQKIGDLKKCPRANGVPAVLLSVSLSFLDGLRKKERIFPFSMFRYSEQEEAILADRIERMLLPMTDLEFYSFFMAKTDLWEKASEEQKAYFKTLYPVDQIDHFRISRALAKTVSKKYQHQNDSQNRKSKSKLA
jgi:hypothetical protein